jgi:translation initiation factor IF-1
MTVRKKGPTRGRSRGGRRRKKTEIGSKDKNVEKVEGLVEEALPATTFRVRLDDDRLILAHLAGKMRLYYIKILPGDRVIVELSPYDTTRGRIIRRL